MALLYSDAEIAALLRERKPLSDDWQTRMMRREKRGQIEHRLDIAGADSTPFSLIIRRSERDSSDFSAILGVRTMALEQLFILRRCDGRSHRHRNAIEGDRFRDFHIHTATERYQRRGYREDGFAQPTERYSDLDGAIRCLFSDAHLDPPPGQPDRLMLNWERR